jgi:RNA polymerase sigma-70 factor (TIGR02943 family)
MLDDPQIDPDAWVDRHADYLYRFAILRLRDPDRASDLVQETFLHALKAVATYSGRSTERTWLVAILKHKIIDAYRKGSRERRADAQPEFEAFGGADPVEFNRNGNWKGGPSAWPGQALERREFWDAVHGCLAAMPSRLAEPFILRELDGMTADEICKLLAITPTNLWARLHRARLALRRCLESRWLGEAARPEEKRS